MPSRLRSLRSSLACPSMRLWIVISINSPGSVLAQSFFFFFWVLKVGSYFQVLGETIHIISEYLSNEAKATSAGSRVVALEAKNSKLRKDLIASIDEANTCKEKAKVLFDDLREERKLTMEKDEQLLAAKEKNKTVVAKSVEAF